MGQTRECPDVEVFTEYVEGRLTPAALAGLQRHVAECRDCGLLYTALPAAPGPVVPSPPAAPTGTLSNGVVSRARADPYSRRILNGTYEIDRIVGQGAHGTVYAARHLRLNRPVAVKVLRVEDPILFERFRREAKITSSLGSRHIAQVTDFDLLEDGTPYIVMELLEGEDLATRIARRGPLDLSEVLKICAEVTTALTVCHRHGIIHRDLKPQNIFLCRTENEGEVVKVIDFGISKVIVPDESLSDTSFGMIGTPLYMSPEQILCKTDLIDKRTDVYALSALLYHALGGEPPYPSQNFAELVSRIVGAAPPPLLSARLPGVPLAVDHVLRRGMGKTREERPASAGELNARLQEAAVKRPTLQSGADDLAPVPVAHGGNSAEVTLYSDSVSTPLWRGRAGKEDELRFAAPEDGFTGGDFRPRSLYLVAGRRELFVGSVPVREEVRNDLVLSHPKVSRSAVRLSVREGRVYLERLTRCTAPVRVGLSLLAPGEERPLHHGQGVIRRWRCSRWKRSSGSARWAREVCAALEIERLVVAGRAARPDAICARSSSPRHRRPPSERYSDR